MDNRNHFKKILEPLKRQKKAQNRYIKRNKKNSQQEALVDVYTAFIKEEDNSPAQKEHRILASKLVLFLGGAENIKSMDYCTTRLRIEVNDKDKVNEAQIEEIVPGIITKDLAVQIIVGPEVEFVYMSIEKLIKILKENK